MKNKDGECRAESGKIRSLLSLPIGDFLIKKTGSGGDE